MSTRTGGGGALAARPGAGAARSAWALAGRRKVIGAADTGRSGSRRRIASTWTTVAVPGPRVCDDDPGSPIRDDVLRPTVRADVLAPPACDAVPGSPVRDQRRLRKGRARAAPRFASGTNALAEARAGGGAARARSGSGLRRIGVELAARAGCGPEPGDRPKARRWLVTGAGDLVAAARRGRSTAVVVVALEASTSPASGTARSSAAHPARARRSANGGWPAPPSAVMARSRPRMIRPGPGAPAAFGDGPATPGRPGDSGRIATRERRSGSSTRPSAVTGADGEGEPDRSRRGRTAAAMIRPMPSAVCEVGPMSRIARTGCARCWRSTPNALWGRPEAVLARAREGC